MAIAKGGFMSNAESIPWDGIVITGLTVVFIFASIYVVNLIIGYVAGCRDALRERYTGGDWRPQLPDLFGVPVWFLLETTCFVGAVVVILLTAWVVYETARGARDWWHAGSRRDR